MTNSYQSYSVPETEINIWGRKSFHCRDQYHFPLLSLGICLKVPIRAWVWNRVTCPPVSCLRVCGQPFKGHRPSAESSMPPLLSCSRGICQCQVALLLLLQTSQELETSVQSHLLLCLLSSQSSATVQGEETQSLHTSRSFIFGARDSWTGKIAQSSTFLTGADHQTKSFQTEKLSTFQSGGGWVVHLQLQQCLDSSVLLESLRALESRIKIFHFHILQIYSEYWDIGVQALQKLSGGGWVVHLQV